MNDPWSSLVELSDTYTCYSSAVATWRASTDEAWAAAVNPGLWLTLTEADDGLFGFVHFPPETRRSLGLRRTGAGSASEALEGVLAEVARSGRAIVAGDGFNLPWHVAFGRVHVPHWYVIVDHAAGLTVLDPFACRNELGIQTATQQVLSPEALAPLLGGLPGDDPVLDLRETLALGDVDGGPGDHGFQWYVIEDVDELREPHGVSGPDAVLRLAEHFRERGQDPSAYSQADDIWSIGRHRAFLCAFSAREAERRGDPVLADWVAEHGAPLAKRWGHMAPLIMQAKLALASSRPASSSVADKLAELAGRERAAAQAAPVRDDRGASSRIP